MARGPVMEDGGRKSEQWALEQYFGLGVESSRSRLLYEARRGAGRKRDRRGIGGVALQHLKGARDLRADLMASVIEAVSMRTWK